MLADDEGFGDADALGVTVEVVEMDGVVEIVVNRLGELKGDNDVLTLAELDADNPDDGVTDADGHDEALWLDDCVTNVLADIDTVDESDIAGDGVTVADTYDEAL